MFINVFSAPAKPNPPVQYIVENALNWDWSTTIKFTWSPITSDGPVQKEYITSWRNPNNGDSWSSWPERFYPRTLFNHMQSNTNYIFTIIVRNIAGDSEPSDETTLFTGEVFNEST